MLQQTNFPRGKEGPEVRVRRANIVGLQADLSLSFHTGLITFWLMPLRQLLPVAT